ncbi:hypothetical protein V3W47_18385 [Deinococcus sp. YIM 134068]|uniref:hypothetical protein n=1 Tax=Deinococcus lichenicola TaxID=3118910 RepID=UPI002F9451BF
MPSKQAATAEWKTRALELAEQIVHRALDKPASLEEALAYARAVREVYSALLGETPAEDRPARKTT